MIIRVRTNLGVTRVEVDGQISVDELRRRIVETLHISSGGHDIVLSLDLAGERLLANGTETLASCGISNGSEVYVCGKYEKKVVEKSFVGTDGEVVPAGTTLVRIPEPGEPIVQTAPVPVVSAAVDVPAIDPRASAVQVEERRDSEVVAKPLTDPAAQEVPTGDSEFNYKDYSELMDYEEGGNDDAVRAPDAVQRMTLLDDASTAGSDFNLSNTPGGRALMQVVLTSQELAQVAQLESALRGAGLPEYEVQREAQNLQDELIARRLQQQQQGGRRDDTLTAALLRNAALGENISAQMDHMDRLLERYHQPALHKKGPALRLPASALGAGSGSNKVTAQRQPQADSKVSGRPAAAAARKVPAAGDNPGATAAPGAVDMSPQISRARSTDSNSPSQHSELTTSVLSGAAPAEIPPSPAQSAEPKSKSVNPGGARSTRAHKPSAALQAARQQQESQGQGGASATATEETGAPAASRLSALQQSALRSLSAQADKKLSAQPAPGAGAASAAATAAADPVDRESASEEDVLYSLLTDHIRRTGSRDTLPTPAKKNAATQDQEKEAGKRPSSGKAGANSSTPAPALSLHGSGYKSMAEVRQKTGPGVAFGPPKKPPGSAGGAAPSSGSESEGARAVVQEVNRPAAAAAVGAVGAAAGQRARPASGTKATPAAKVEAPSARNGTNATSHAAGEGKITRQPAPYSMQPERGVLQGRAGAVGGVATTVVSAPTKRSGKGPAVEDYNVSDEMDETLALALQMSLEDNTHRAPRNRWAQETSPARSPVQQYMDAQNQGRGDFAQTVAEADAAVEMARRLQEQYDAEAAAEFLRYEEEHGLIERQYQEQRNREQERVHLRGRLFGAETNDRAAGGRPQDAALPAWLDRTITEDANNGILDLAMQASFEDHHYGGFVPARATQQNPAVRHAPQQPVHQLQPPRQRLYQAPAPAQGHAPRAVMAGAQQYYPGNPTGVEYDEEDEILARALQDSLDEEVWG